MNNSPQCRVVEKNEASFLQKLQHRTIKILKVPRCYVRYDKSSNSWAVVTFDASKILERFDYGIMKDVVFEIAKLEIPVYTCGYESVKTEFAGIAYGLLGKNLYGDDFSSFHHLGFDGGAFRNQNGDILTDCQYLRLMPNRKALYK